MTQNDWAAVMLTVNADWNWHIINHLVKNFATIKCTVLPNHLQAIEMLIYIY